jgi:hypothetical protein
LWINKTFSKGIMTNKWYENYNSNGLPAYSLFAKLTTSENYGAKIEYEK